MDIKPFLSRHSKHPVSLPSSRPVQREDAQPNETSSGLPYRLRRPIEPPTIKPAASQSHSNLIKPSSLHLNNRHHPPHFHLPCSKGSSSYRTSSPPYYPHRSSSYRRPNHPYAPTLPPPVEKSTDSYHFRRHSAYEEPSQLDLHSSRSSSNPRSISRLNPEPHSHFHSNSSIFPPTPQGSVSIFSPKAPVSCETHPIQTAKQCPSCPVSNHLHTSQPKHPLIIPNPLIVPSIDCMRQKRINQASISKRSPSITQVAPIPPHHPRRPTSPHSHPDQHHSPPFKKRKVSDDSAPDRPSGYHSPNEHSPSHDGSHRAASQTSRPRVEPDPPNCDTSTSVPSHTVIVDSMVALHSTRRRVVNLIYELLEHLGPISDVSLDDFIKRKRCIKISLTVTFQHFSAAINARWQRSIQIPPPFLYAENTLLISPKLSQAEKIISAHLLPASRRNWQRQSHPPSFHAQGFISQGSNDKGSGISHDTTPKPAPDQDLDMLSTPNETNEQLGDSHQSRCSSSPPMTRPTLQKVKVLVRQSNGDYVERCVEPAPSAEHSSQSLHLQGADTSSKPHNSNFTNWILCPSPPSHRSVSARIHLNKDMSRPASIQLIRGILGSVGKIADVTIDSFSQGKKAVFLSCTVVFDEVEIAQQVLSKRRYPVPSPYAHNGNRLIVFSKESSSPQVSTDVEPVQPLGLVRPSLSHTGSLPACHNSTAKHLGSPHVKHKVSVVIHKNHSSLPWNLPDTVASLSESTPAHPHQEDDQSSEEIPLRNTKPRKQFSDMHSVQGPLHHGSVNHLTSGDCDNKINQPVSSNLVISPPADAGPTQLWIKGHFYPTLKRKKIESFIKNISQPFGKIIDFKFTRRKLGVCDCSFTFKDSTVAAQAVKSLHGATVPPDLAFSKTRPYYLHVSFDYSSDAGCLALSKFRKSKPTVSVPSVDNELPHERDSRAEPLIPAPTTPSSVHDDSESVHSSPRSSPRPTRVKNEPNDSPKVAPTKNHIDFHPPSLSSASPPPSLTSTSHSIALISASNAPSDNNRDAKLLEPPPAQLGLPLRVVKYPFPPSCQDSHPSYVSNRLHFKLEKIRLLSTQDETVLDTSWDAQYLILHVVTKSEDSSLPHRVQPPVVFNPISTHPSNPSAHLKTTAPHTQVDELSNSKKNCLVTSLIPSNNPSIATTSSPKHNTWPFDPLPMFLDDSVLPDLPKTLNDFLATFFRLWEESRLDLQFLYDPSAVFSNILAKQGRKPLAITKSTGWPSIYQSIRRLPALSNDPMSDLIIDACPYSLNPPRVVCNVHGSFSEFPKTVKRAFDRTLILRPVDTRLHPSEGCLGMLKWITLSDTLTIRKHSARTEAIVEGFTEKRNRSAYTPITPEADLARQALEDTRGSSQLSGVEADVRVRSASSRRSTYSPIRISSPLHQVDVFEYSPGDNVHRMPNRKGQDPSSPTAAISENIDQPQGDLAQMQSELRALQAEIQHLKSMALKPSPLTSTNQEVQRGISHENTSQISHSAQSDNFKVVNSTSCSHVGFGVSVKRLLVPTNLSRYVIISMRGDILIWNHTHPDTSSQVRLILSGASPTDIVDSASYSNLSQTLIVGSRPSKMAKNCPNSNVRLVKLQKSSLNDNLICQRIELEAPHHENGVRALTLSPNRMTETDSTTSFLTAGQEKFISLWKVTNPNGSNSLKQTKHFHTDIHQIHTDHTSVIQALAVDHTRQWILSGGQDGKVYVTDLGRSNCQTLFLEEKNQIFDIQMNPVVQDSVMITTGNKAPGSQFRHCDLRMAKPVISFGLAPNIYGNIESPIKYHRKGSLRDYLFSYPNGEKGGVLVWDLRYPTVPSSSLNTGHDIGVQSHFESMNSLVVLAKEHLTRSEFMLL